LTPAISAVLLLSDVPKLVPINVTVAPDVVGTFGTCKRVTAGESNVKLENSVPVFPSKDMVTLFFPIPVATAHATLVSDTHVVLAQLVGDTPPAWLPSSTPKLRPLNVTIPPPVAGLFVGVAKVMLGVSNVNDLNPVPTTALRDSCTD